MADDKSSTVTVALKYPHGLVLRLFKMAETQEAQQGGGTKTVQKAQPTQHTVKLNGYNEKYDPALPPAARSSSYALTHNVPRDFMEEWLRQNHDHDLVRNNLLFIQGSAESMRSKVRELNKETMCGLEPIDPSKLDPKGKLSPYKQEASA